MALLLCLNILPRAQTWGGLARSLPAGRRASDAERCPLPPWQCPSTPLSSVSHSPCMLGQRSQRSAFWTLNPEGRIKFLVRGRAGIFRALWLVWLKLEVSHNLGRLGHPTLAKADVELFPPQQRPAGAPPNFSFGKKKKKKHLPPFILHEWHPGITKIRCK